jgi:hypothetical protein
MPSHLPPFRNTLLETLSRLARPRTSALAMDAEDQAGMRLYQDSCQHGRYRLLAHPSWSVYEIQIVLFWPYSRGDLESASGITACRVLVLGGMRCSYEPHDHGGHDGRGDPAQGQPERPPAGDAGRP